jgi:hypothetical protein
MNPMKSNPTVTADQCASAGLYSCHVKPATRTRVRSALGPHAAPFSSKHDENISADNASTSVSKYFELLWYAMNARAKRLANWNFLNSCERT